MKFLIFILFQFGGVLLVESQTCPEITKECVKPCEIGLDEKKCRACICPDPCKGVDCGIDQNCLADDQFPVCVRKPCPEIECLDPCEKQLDQDGCQICICSDPCDGVVCGVDEECVVDQQRASCVKKTCPDIKCPDSCEIKKDEKGCPSCLCKQICSRSACGGGEACLVNQIYKGICWRRCCPRPTPPKICPIRNIYQTCSLSCSTFLMRLCSWQGLLCCPDCFGNYRCVRGVPCPWYKIPYYQWPR